MCSPQPSASDILRRHGRSFHFAARFLGAEHAARGAVVYAFCRSVDDAVDEAADADQARAALAAISRDLASGQSTTPAVAEFLALQAATGLDPRLAPLLLHGVSMDLGPVAMDDETELVRYAYHVAGGVGVMMCAALDVSDERALPFAIDLGIAMQLTNIARDVVEDAQMGRRYVPAPWLADLSAADIAAGGADLAEPVAQARRKLVGLAERYYFSAERGMGYLPPRARLAILIAARVYRAIGLKRVRQGVRQGVRRWRARTVVSGPAKLMWAARAAGAFLTQPHLHARATRHDETLHRAIADLPGADRGR